MVWWLVQHTLVVAALVALVAVASWTFRPAPATRHALWFVVLLKLMTPPLVSWPWAVGAGTSDAEIVRNDVATPSPLIDSVPDEPLVVAPNAFATSIESAPFEPPLKEPFVYEPFMPQPASEIEPPSRMPIAAQSAESDSPVARATAIGWPSPFVVISTVVAVGFAWQAVLILRIRKALARTWPAAQSLIDEVAGIATRLGVRPPRVLVAERLRSPFVWCLGRPVLVWPATLADVAGRESWRGVIAHELAHLKRRDHWVARLEMLAACLWWWNPLFHVIRRRLHENSELACDAWAVSILPDGRKAFAEALVEVSALACRPTPLPALGAAAGDRRAFHRRLEMILCQRVPVSVPRRGLAALGLIWLVTVPVWSQEGEQTAADQSAPAATTQEGVSAAANPQSQPLETGGIATSVPAASADARETRRREHVEDALSYMKTHPAALSPDGRVVAISNGGAELNLFDVDSGKIVGTAAFREPVRSLAWSPDGLIAAVGFDGGAVALIQSTGLEVVQLVGHKAAVRALAFSPDGSTLATAGEDQTIRLWDVATHAHESLLQPEMAVDCLTYSPNGRWLAAACRTPDQRGLIQFWDADAKTVSATVSRDEGPAFDMAYSPDGAGLVVVGVGPIQFVDSAAAAILPTRRNQLEDQCSVAISPDGSTLVTGSSNGMMLFGTFKFRGVAGPEIGVAGNVKHSDEIPLSVAFAPDGRMLLLSKSGGSLIPVLVSPADADPDFLRRVQHASQIASAAGVRGQSTAQATGSSGDAAALIRERMMARQASDSGLHPAAISPDGKLVALSNGAAGVHLIDLATSRPTATMTLDNRVRSIAYSPDGRVIAIGDDIGTVILADLTGKQLAGLEGHASAVQSLAFSPDGRTLVSGGEDWHVVFWDVAGQSKRAQINAEQPVWSVAFSPDGKQLAVATGDLMGWGRTGVVQLWDAMEKTLIRSESVGALASAVIFSHDGKRLVVGTVNTPLMYWGLQTTSIPVGIPSRLKNVISLAWSSDGEALLAVTRDGNGEILSVNWDGLVGPEFQTIGKLHHGNQIPLAAVFSPDGRVLQLATNASGSLIPRLVSVDEASDHRIAETRAEPPDNIHDVATQLRESRALLGQMRKASQVDMKVVERAQQALEGLLSHMQKEGRPVEQLLTEVYLLTLNRRPEETELAWCKQQLETRPMPEGFYSDLVYLLVNSKEFFQQRRDATGGVAITDVDGDGEPDIYVSGAPVAIDDPVVRTQSLERAVYRLPMPKSQVLVNFLRDTIPAEIETKIEGDTITITAAPEVQKTIGELIGLMQVRAPGDGAARRP